MAFPTYTKEKWLRIVLYAVNGVFMVFGFLLILWGSLTIANAGGLGSIDIAISSITTLPVLAIVLGFAIFVLAILGIVGTKAENYVVALVYSVLLGIITILQIALVIWMFVKRDDFISTISDSVDRTFMESDKLNNYPFDSLEIALNCCGVHGYQDYKTVPSTCCGIPRSNKKVKCKKPVYSSRPGCGTLIKEFWQSNINLVRWVGVVIILLELGTLWIAITLVQKYRNSKKVDIEQQQVQK